MFTVILQDGTGKELARCSSQGNEKYLMPTGGDFLLLSQLDTSSYDVFSQDQARQLHEELLALQAKVAKDSELEHIRDVAELAFRAANTAGATITFTPLTR